MSRRSQYLQRTDGYFHAYNRGVDRGTIFFRPSDYEVFLLKITEYLPDADVNLLVYSLLPNHFHLILQQSSPYAISAYMKNVSENYVRYLNCIRNRSGHLFRGRYGLGYIKDDSGLLRMSHYIHFNPVAAGLVRSVFDWKYSSCREYANPTRSNLVNVEPILTLVGGNEKYMSFLNTYEPSDPESVVRYIVKPEDR